MSGVRTTERPRAALAGFRLMLAIAGLTIGGILAWTSVRTYLAAAAVQRAEAHLEWGRLEAAHQAMLSALHWTPGDARLHARTSRVQRALGRFRDDAEYAELSIASLHRAARLDPASARIHAELGSALTDLERYAEAADAYRQALERDPNNALYLASLGLVEKQLGRTDEAAALFRRSLAIAPDADVEALLEDLEP